MKIYRSRKIPTFIALLLISLAVLSCDDLVEDGYRIDYAPSDATLSIVPIGYEMGSEGDIVSYSITANSANSIKSLVVESKAPGASGSGYDVGTVGFDDPFADHGYGTMQKNVTSFTVKYDYVVPKEVNKSTVVFSLIDEQGKVSSEVNIAVVPSITQHDNISLISKDELYFDAGSSIDGFVYQDIKTNYSSRTQENIDVQEKIDLVFYVNDNGSSIICSPAHSGLNIELDIENATKFKRMSSITNEDFDSITPASLVALTETDSIGYYGRSSVSDVKVDDIIGFTTDQDAIHSFKTGLVRVNALHPTTVSRYEGKVYIMECDIVTQIEE